MNVDQSKYRTLDYLTGRWWQVDPKSEAGQESWSTYQFGFDNPIRYNDPEGDCPENNPKCEERTGKASGPGTSTDPKTGDKSAHVAKAEIHAQDKTGNFDASVTFLGGKTGGKKLEGDKSGVGTKGKSEASVLGVQVSQKIEGEHVTGAGEVKVDLLAVRVQKDVTVNKDGVAATLSAGAFTGKAEGSFSLDFGAVKIEVGGMVTGASAHIGGTIQANSDGLALKGNAGLGVGGGAGISITWE